MSDVWRSMPNTCQHCTAKQKAAARAKQQRDAARREVLRLRQQIAVMLDVRDDVVDFVFSDEQEEK